MRNLRLAAKIGVGFGLVIAMTIALGVIAVVSMLSVQKTVERLNVEAVPQVVAANELERSSLLAMYNIRGYTLSLNEDDLKLGRDNLAQTQAKLTEAEALAARFPRLIFLRKNVTDAKLKIELYKALLDQTELTNIDMRNSRRAQDAAAAAFMDACGAYLKSMNENLAADLNARKIKAMILQRLDKINSIYGIIDLGNALRYANLQTQAGSDPEILKKALQDLARLEPQVKALLAVTAQQSNRASLQAVLTAGSDFAAASQKVLDDSRRLVDINAARNNTAQAVLDAAKTTSAAGIKDADEVTALAVARLLSAVIVLIIGLAGAAFVAISLAVAITRAITRPLSRGVVFAQQVAAGDFTQRLDIGQQDEVGMLARALNGMSEKLHDMVIAVQENARRVASSSEEIATGAQKLAEGAQTQASTLEQTSASMEQLSASVEQVSGNARSQTAAVAQGAGPMTQVQKSIEDVSGSLLSISALARESVENAVQGAKAVASVVTGIGLIAASSEKIGGIVNVISDIADQTNLLALNASIEAARAGEHGRGFAVVAEEVSKLADRSASSTKEIEALIRESVRNVNEGVATAKGSQSAMEQIREASRKVNEMIGRLTESVRLQVTGVNELARALENVKEMSQSISAAAEQQTTSAHQVSRAIGGVSDVTQSTASSAEEMSAATAELSGMAQDLQRLVAHFKVEGTGNGGAHAGAAASGAAATSSSPSPGVPPAAALPLPVRTPYFPWSEAMSVKVPRIDAQHKRLVELVNTLYAEMIEKRGQEAQKRTIDGMVEYAAAHFAHEEEAMRRFGFPGMVPHKAEHEAFTRKARELRQRADGDGFILTMEILDYLKGWLQRHIMGVDRQYMECFAEHGLR